MHLKTNNNGLVPKWFDGVKLLGEFARDTISKL
jgi:hypothetical protein